jgi:hypothetical protein
VTSQGLPTTGGPSSTSSAGRGLTNPCPTTVAPTVAPPAFSSPTPLPTPLASPHL